MVKIKKTKAKKKYDFIRLKSFCAKKKKEILNKRKRKLNWRKMLSLALINSLAYLEWCGMPNIPHHSVNGFLYFQYYKQQ